VSRRFFTLCPKGKSNQLETAGYPMRTTKQETSPGTENLEEEDTYDLLERLTPAKRGRCRGNTKAVGRACVKAWEPQAVTLDDRVGVAVSRAANYLLTLPERAAEVKLAAEDVLRTARALERRGQ
jgi:hypothetical protein